MEPGEVLQNSEEATSMIRLIPDSSEDAASDQVEVHHLDPPSRLTACSSCYQAASCHMMNLVADFLDAAVAMDASSAAAGRPS